MAVKGSDDYLNDLLKPLTREQIKQAMWLRNDHDDWTNEKCINEAKNA